MNSIICLLSESPCWRTLANDLYWRPQLGAHSLAPTAWRSQLGDCKFDVIQRYANLHRDLSRIQTTLH